MFTKNARTGPAPEAPEDPHFQEQSAPDAAGDAGDDTTLAHEGPLNVDVDPSECTGGDPYNTTGRFTLSEGAQKYPAAPEVPKIIARR